MKASTANGTTTTLPFTGLTRVGTSYTLTVFASNLIGDGVASSPSAAVTIGGKADPPTSVKVCGSGGQLWVVFTPVAGASSYDIYYSATSPATSGTKVNRAASPAGIPVASGTYYVAVEAVTAVGDGLPSTDVTATVTGQLHDVLFVAEPSTPAVDIYDCYSNLPDGTSAPTRSLSTSIDGSSNSPVAVDGVNRDPARLQRHQRRHLAVARQRQRQQRRRLHHHASHGRAPDRATIDAAHQKLYALGDGECADPLVLVHDGGEPQRRHRQRIHGTFSPIGAMAVDAATGNLWYTQIPTTSSLRRLRRPVRLAAVQVVLLCLRHRYVAVDAAPRRGVRAGHLGNDLPQQLAGDRLVQQYATHAIGAVPMDGSINFGATALTTGNSMLIGLASATSQVRAWSTAP